MPEDKDKTLFDNAPPEPLSEEDKKERDRIGSALNRFLTSAGSTDPRVLEERQKAIKASGSILSDSVDVAWVADSVTEETVAGFLPAKRKYIKTSITMERQLIGRRDEPTLFENLLAEDKELRDGIELANKNKDTNIVDIGADFSLPQMKALKAVQVLYTRTNYRGNYIVPDGSQTRALRITRADYLEAYGVHKTKNKEGYSVFIGNEAEIAMEALSSLSKEIFWCFREKDIKTNRYNLITGKAPVLTVFPEYHQITEKESDKIINSKEISPNKLSHLIILPHEFFFRGESGYIFYPADLFLRIKEKYPRAKAYFYRFVTFLNMEATHGRYSRTGKEAIYYDTLADIMRLGAYKKRKQVKEIQKLVNKALDMSKELGLLKSFEPFQKNNELACNWELDPPAYYQEIKAPEGGEDNKALQ